MYKSHYLIEIHYKIHHLQAITLAGSKVLSTIPTNYLTTSVEAPRDTNNLLQNCLHAIHK